MGPSDNGTRTKRREKNEGEKIREAADRKS